MKFIALIALLFIIGCGGIPDHPADKKLVVIGFDSADWQAIDPLISAGEMPNFKSFLDSGIPMFSKNNFRSFVSCRVKVISPCSQTAIESSKSIRLVPNSKFFNNAAWVKFADDSIASLESKTYNLE